MENRNPDSRFGAFNNKWSVSEASKLFCVETDKGHPDLPVLSASQEHGMVKRDNIGINMQYSKQNVASYVKEVAKANSANINIKKFVRFETGEGIEKKQEDFAAEVAKQMGM